MKLTKKMIREAAQYIIVMDYKACYRGASFAFYEVKGNNIVEAMQFAEEMFDETQVYLVNIAEKTGEVDVDANIIMYKEIMTTRGKGQWHICDKKHCETSSTIAHNVEFNYYDIVKIDF